MLFTICQNSMLDGTYHLTYRLPFTIRDLIKRHIAQYARRACAHRAVQVVFGNMVDMGDRMNGHPGTNSFDISRFDSVILLLETLHRLKGIESSKG